MCNRGYPLPLELHSALARKARTRALPLIPHETRVGMTVASTTCTVTGPGYPLARAGKPARTVARLIATSSRTEGEGTRFVWIDPRIPRAEVRRLASFGNVAAAYPCQTTYKSMALPAALSGFRLTRLSDPKRQSAASSGQQQPRLCRRRRQISIPGC